MKLRGGPLQTAGGVWVVDSPGEVESLLRVLYSTSYPVGLDLEFTYVPKRHNLEHTRITCMTLAYVDPELGKHWAGCPLARRVFIPAFDDDSLIQQLKPWLESDRPKVGHNIISADAHVLVNHGITLNGIETDTLRTSRMTYNSKDIRHGLKPRIQAELGYDVVDLETVLCRPKRLKGKVYKRVSLRKPGKTSVVQVPTLFGGEVSCVSWKSTEVIPQAEYWKDYPRDPFIDYASLDAKGTLELSFLHERRLRQLPARGGDSWALWRDFWRPYCLLVAETERNGVCLDVGACSVGAASADCDIRAYDDALYQHRLGLDWNWNSSDDLRELLYTHWRMPRSPIKGTMRAIKPTKPAEPAEFSTSEASLHWLQLQCLGNPERQGVIDLIRRRKKAVRLMGYLTSLPGFVHSDGRIHPMVAPSTDTGRLAASCPPLQQIPGVKGDKYGIRRAFVAAPGRVLVVADYSQLEVYILAHYLRRLFSDNSIADALATGDVYGAVAKQCWPDELAGIDARDIKHHPSKLVQSRRDTSKVVVLATNYCMSAQGLAISLLDETGTSIGLEAANSYLTGYDSRFPGVGEFQRYMARMAAKHGGVSDIMGFWRPLPAARSDYEGERAGAFRQAANTPIQGSAAKIVALAMLLLKHRYPWVLQLLQVHDEIIAEVPEDRGPEACVAVEECMVAAGEELEMRIGLKAEVKQARCWADGK